MRWLPIVLLVVGAVPCPGQESGRAHGSAWGAAIKLALPLTAPAHFTKISTSLHDPFVLLR